MWCGLWRSIRYVESGNFENFGNARVRRLELNSCQIILNTEYNRSCPMDSDLIFNFKTFQNGPGPSSDEIRVTTMSDAPADTPHNVTVESASSTVHLIAYYAILHFLINNRA